jgi:dienelactone hydrolase
MKGAGAAVTAVTIAVAFVLGLAPYWTAATLIARAAGTQGWIGSVARLTAKNVSQSIEQVPVGSSTVRARMFRPDGTPTRAALLVSGVHPDGIDEPRLISLAHELAATGVVVVTPEIDDLLHYRITARVTDTIEDVARWMTTRADVFGHRAIGLIGVSFSGGLSIVAAGRPSLRNRVAYVLSFGGHGDLPRVLHYLFTGEGSPHRPHDYALAIVLHQAADLAVPQEQVAALRQGLETFLAASALNRTDPVKAKQLFGELRAMPSHMPEPAATLMRYVNERDVAALGKSLLPHLSQLGQDPALSPERSLAPIAPVYLLHGTDDNVIPAFESEHLAEYLRGKTRVDTLIGGFLTHVDVAGRPSAKDTWDMITFWKRMLDEYDAEARN